MKKILLFSALAVSSLFVKAQDLKYGLKAGVNFANQKASISGISISSSSVTSYHLTGFVDIGISENFSFQPGLSLQGKGAKSDIKDDDSGANFKSTENISYLEIPLNAVYYLPAGSGKVFLGAGPYAAFGLFGKSKAEMSGFPSVSEDASFGNGENDTVTPMDFGLNFMAGYRLDNGILLNAGYGLGLANIMPKDQRFGDSKGTNNVFSISVGYSF